MQETRPVRSHRGAIGAASLSLLLAACGGSGGDSNDSGNNNVTPPPPSVGLATIDTASVTKAIPDISSVIPVCSRAAAGGVTIKSAKGAANTIWLARLVSAREMGGLRMGPTPKALGATKPADALGECGGRRGYPSYSHANGVTTCTLSFDNYCSLDSGTGNRTILNGSMTFVNTGTPTPTGPVTTRIEASSPNGLTLRTQDSTGKVLSSQAVTFTDFLSTIGVPGGAPTAAKPDVFRFAEIRYTSAAGQTYRESNFALTRFETPAGGEQMTLTGRGYRSNGDYFDVTTTVPVASDSSGRTTGGQLTFTGANGANAVMTMVPGSTLQATMTVNGTTVTGLPACK